MLRVSKRNSTASTLHGNVAARWTTACLRSSSLKGVKSVSSDVLRVGLPQELSLLPPCL